VRVLAGLMMAFGGSLNLGIFPIIEARFLTITTGIPPRFVAWTMAALLLVALVYTALGGMLSLIVTNYLQYVLLAAGTLIVTAVCLSRIGWSGMSGAVLEHMHGRGLDPFADLGVGPAFILWQVLLWLAFMTVWQSAAMRAFSARDAATGRKVFTLTSVLFLGRAVIPMAWGIAALAFFFGRATPLASPVGEAPGVEMTRLDAELATTFKPLLDEGRLETLLPRVDRLETLAQAERSEPHAQRARALREEMGMVAMPWMVAALVPAGWMGLVMAGMLAASVSTYAGYFLGWSAVISQDVVSPLLGRELSEQGKLRLTRVTIVALTAFIMVWSLVYEVPGPAYFYLQVTANLFMAPTLLTIVLAPRRGGVAGVSGPRGRPRRGRRREPELGARPRRPGPRLAVATLARPHGRPGGGMSWLTLWAIVFYASVASFALVSALVAVFGYREVRELFASLAARNRDA